MIGHADKDPRRSGTLRGDGTVGIGAWIAFYNTRRPHQALDNRTPMAVWRDGVMGEIGETAVDMTLRLDNAGALPTCPQPQQQQLRVA
jgi:putative transposase